MKYEEAWQKITTAYVNDKLNPYMPCACFIGNLLGNIDWAECRWGEAWKGEGFPVKFHDYFALKGYSPREIINMENNFLRIIYEGVGKPSLFDAIAKNGMINIAREHPDYEDLLYKAMVSTLEMLRQIHIAKGEVIDEIPLRKRELQTA